MSTVNDNATTGGLLINAKVQAGAPSGYVSAVSSAITYFEAKFSNFVTMNLQFDWAPLSGSAVAQSSTSLSFYSCSAVTSALAATDASIAPDRGLKLPGSDPFAVSSWNPLNELPLTHSEAAAIGLSSPDSSRSNTTLDATITLNSNLSYFNPPNVARGAYDAVSTLEHEISEVMGRQCGGNNSEGIIGTPDGLFRFTPSGHINTTDSITGNYFSINGGVTNLHGALGEPGGDLADWNSATKDCVGFAVTGREQEFTAADVRVMEALGWQQSGSAVAPTSGIDLRPVTTSAPLVAVNSYAGLA